MEKADLYIISGPVTYSEQWLTESEAADPIYKTLGLKVYKKFGEVQT